MIRHCFSKRSRYGEAALAGDQTWIGIGLGPSRTARSILHRAHSVEFDRDPALCRRLLECRGGRLQPLLLLRAVSDINLNIVGEGLRHGGSIAPGSLLEPAGGTSGGRLPSWAGRSRRRLAPAGRPPPGRPSGHSARPGHSNRRDARPGAFRPGPWRPTDRARPRRPGRSIRSGRYFSAGIGRSTSFSWTVFDDRRLTSDVARHLGQRTRPPACSRPTGIGAWQDG